MLYVICVVCFDVEFVISIVEGIVVMFVECV